MTGQDRERLGPAQRALTRSTEALALVSRAKRLFLRRFPTAEADDVEALAHEALMLAARRYDASLGVPFAGYAAQRVMGHLKRELVRERYRKAPLAALLAEAEARGARRAAGEEGGANDGREEARQRLGGSLASRSWELLLVAMLHSSQGPDPEQMALGRELRRVLAEGKASLGEEAGYLLRRRFDDGVGVAALAAELGVSTSTVERRLVRAMAQLRAFVRARWGSSPGLEVELDRLSDSSSGARAGG
ncbi:MAG: sigma-70 family RNA polymerase sigma factor [Polyangiaceae bacterium]